MTYSQARERAILISEQSECTVHVCAKVEIRNGQPFLLPDGYSVSDWYDGSVIATYTNGKDHN